MTAQMKSLFFICLLFVLHGTAVSWIRVYFYLSQAVPWSTAQSYCQANYLDLATITTEVENQNVLRITGQTSLYTWIGLNSIANTWQWSDGEQPTFTNWKRGEPKGVLESHGCTVISQTGWLDDSCQLEFPFICYLRFTLVKERKTWEEALKYCRSNYTDMAFVNSEIMLDLLKIETQQAQTASVWTGLRFLNGKWFWVNGNPVESLVSVPSCPVEPYRCGAFNFNTYVWEIRDCNKELNFICYY